MRWTVGCEHDLKDDAHFNLVQKPQSEQLTPVEGNIQSVLLSRSEFKINFLFLFYNCAFAVILCFNYVLLVLLLVCFTLENILKDFFHFFQQRQFKCNLNTLHLFFFFQHHSHFLVFQCICLSCVCASTTAPSLSEQKLSLW